MLKKTESNDLTFEDIYSPNWQIFVYLAIINILIYTNVSTNNGRGGDRPWILNAIILICLKCLIGPVKTSHPANTTRWTPIVCLSFQKKADISELAESFGMMMVKVEAREFRLKEIIKELEQVKAE